jgi:serine O-acetyltransferase
MRGVARGVARARVQTPAAVGDEAPPLDEIVDALVSANERFALASARVPVQRPLPSRDAIAAVVDDLRAVLFPSHFGATGRDAQGLRYALGARLDRARRALAEQVWRGLAFTCDHAGGRERCGACAEQARSLAGTFAARLPAVRALLERDVRAAYDGDPAAAFVDEPLLCYPGVDAIIQHRLAHELHRLAVPLVPRIVSELAHAATGIDIHPGAQIGASFFIDHGTGVVIGETCAIGERVRLYQGVTLGARGFPSDADGHPVKGLPRHPTVEDDVVIYAGATILGRITIGRGATIGGNVWLTRSVGPGARVTQAQARQDTFEGGGGI